MNPQNQADIPSVEVAPPVQPLPVVEPVSLVRASQSLDSDAQTTQAIIDAADEQAKSELQTRQARLRRRRKIRFTLLGIALVIGLVLVGLRIFGIQKSGTKAASDASQRFGNISIPLNNIPNDVNEKLITSAQSVTINGKLAVNNTLVVSPTSQPTSAVAGQLYYDQTSNQLLYYNGNQFVGLLGGTVGQGLSTSNGVLANTGVLSVQGNTGNVTLVGGPGVLIDGTTLSNSGVISIGGARGTIGLGSGLSVTGTTLRNSGIISATAGANVTIANDGSGNITIGTTASSGGGITSPGGTPGTLPVFTAGQTVGDSLVSQSGSLVTVNGNLQATNLTLTGALQGTSANLSGLVTANAGLTVSGTTTLNGGLLYGLAVQNNTDTATAALNFDGTIQTITVAPSAPSTGIYVANNLQTQTASANAAGATLIGSNSSAVNNGTSTAGTLEAGGFSVTNTSTGTINTATALTAGFTKGSGSIITGYNLQLSNAAGQATNAYSIYSAGGTNLFKTGADNVVGLTVQGNSGSQAANLLQFADSSGNINSAFNALGNQLTLGNATASGTTQGTLRLSDGTSDGFFGSLKVASPLSGNMIYTLPNEAGTICLQNSANCGFLTGAAANGSYIQLQGTTPGTAQTGNFNITGTGIANNLRTNSLDTASTGTLAIGTANATSVTTGSVTTTTITIGQATGTSTIAIGDSNISTGTQTINIGTSSSGSGKNNITIGSTFDGSNTTIQGGTGNVNLRTNSSGASIIAKTSTNAAAAFQIQNSANVAIFTADTIGNQVILGTTGSFTGQIGFKGGTAASGVINLVGQTNPTGTRTITLPDGSGTLCLDSVVNNCGYLTGAAANSSYIQLQGTTPGTAQTGNFNITGTGIANILQAGSIVDTGTLSFQGSSSTTYTTPLGTGISTKINIPNYDPGAFGQILALGLPSTADSTARVLTVLDARTTVHQPTINVISPDENQVFGLSWDGSNTTARLKTSAANLVLQSADQLLWQSNGTTLLALDPSPHGAGTSSISIGSAAGSTGEIQFYNATNASSVTLRGGTPAFGYTIQLPTSLGAVGQCTYVASIASSVETLDYNNCLNDATGVKLQGGTPGTAQTGNFNITGTGIANILQSNNVNTATLDTPAGTPVLNIGTTNAVNGINLNQATTVASGKTFQALGASVFQDSTNSTTAFRVQDTSNANIFAVDTQNSKIVLGNTATRDGVITFNNSGNSNAVTLLTGLTSTSYNIILPTSAGNAGQCLYIASKPSSVDEQLGHTDCLTAANAIQLQATTPGTAQTGNFNITGTGIAGSLKSGSVDTASAGALNIGTGSATSITLGNSSSNIATTINGTALVKPTSGNDSAVAFQVQNAAGTSILNVDTSKGILTTLDHNVGSITTLVSPGRIMSDGFESGSTSLWTTTQNVSADTAQARNGLYAAKINSSSSISYIGKTTAAESTVYARAYVYATTNTTTGTPDFMIVNSTNSHYSGIRRTNTGVLELALDNGASSLSTGVQLPLNQWNKVELKVVAGTGSSGSVTMWLNGMQYGPLTGSSFVTSFNRFNIGEDASSTQSFWADDVAVDNVSPGDSASLTVNDSFHVAGTASFGGNVLIQTDSNATNVFQIQNTAGTSILTADTTTSTITVSNLAVQGHIITTGNTPGIAAGAGAGSGPTVSISGTDVAGIITVTTGSGATTGKLAGVTFATAFGASPNVVLTPANASAASLQSYVDSGATATTGFDLDALSPGASTTYKWYYHVIQ